MAATLYPQPMLRNLDPSVVIDIGANRGQFALDVMSACPNASVICFEPLPSEADVLVANLGSLSNLHVVRSAVSDTSGSTMIHVSAAADSSSLHRPTDLQATTFPGTQEIGQLEVPMIALDDVEWPTEVGDTTLLKIDVQGHELAVLRGAKRLLDRIRWVYVEVSLQELYEGQALAGEVFQQLHTAGYRLIDLSDPVRRRGRAIQVDAWFERVGAEG